MESEQIIKNNKVLENNKEWKNISVEHDFDDNVFGFVMEEKFKLLNYTYTYINKMYDDIANFPKKHEMIKKQLVKTLYFLLHMIEKNKMISTKMIHKLRLQLDNISKCLVGWRKAI